MEILKMIKDVLPTLVLLMVVLVWLGLLFVTWRNDIRRHQEVSAFIELFQKSNKDLLLAYANTISRVRDQKHLFIFRMPDGSLKIQALDLDERGKVAEELERQRNNSHGPDTEIQPAR